MPDADLDVYREFDEIANELLMSRRRLDSPESDVDVYQEFDELAGARCSRLHEIVQSSR